MKKTEQSGARTLLMSVMLSSPGPIVVGIGLFMGKSSTQLADFVRRSAELCAILVSYFIYRTIHKDETEQEAHYKARLERRANLCVGVAMCLSGLAMLFIALLGGSSEKGNVIPGLSIAFLGLVTNSWFWLRYAKLAKENGDAILSVQSRLYQAKSFVDACVFIVLLIVTIASFSEAAHQSISSYTTTEVMVLPLTKAAYWADIGGAIIVSAYLIANGIAILKKHLKLA